MQKAIGERSGLLPKRLKPSISLKHPSVRYDGRRRMLIAALPNTSENVAPLTSSIEVPLVSASVPTQEPAAMYTTTQDPRYAQPIHYQQMYYPPSYSQQNPSQQYYVGVPPQPMYPTPPLPAKSIVNESSAVPWWIWIALGALAMKTFDMMQNFFRRGPQQVMSEMAMKAMMNDMAKNGPPGQSPFGNYGAPPMGGLNRGFGATGPTVETTATSVPGDRAVPDYGSSRSGQRFAARKAVDYSTDGKRDNTNTGSTTSWGSPQPQAKSSFFRDVGDEEADRRARGTNNTAEQASSAAGSSKVDGKAATSMFESMLRNPSMQKMLYQYLPEPMRNPESIEFMLSNPAVRAQMEKMFNEQGLQNMSPQMLEMMSKTDFNPDKINQEMAQLGLKPDEVMQKLMSEPGLAASFSNPRIQAALMDINQNPMNMLKYQSDPEVTKVLEKLAEVMTPSKPPGAS